MSDHWLAITGVALGVMAIIMAIPPLFQMMFGRTDFGLGTDEFDGPEGKELLVTMKNKPISARWLKWIGVERETGDVFASFSIRDQGTSQFVCRHVSGHMICAITAERGLSIKATVGHTIGVPIVHFREGKAWIVDGRHLEDFQEIPAGDYRVETVIFSGQKTFQIQKDFRIGPQRHQMFWY